MDYALEKHSLGFSGGGFHWLDFHCTIHAPRDSQDHLVSVCGGHCKMPSWWFIIRCIWWSALVKPLNLLPLRCAADSEVIFTYRWTCKVQIRQNMIKLEEEQIKDFSDQECRLIASRHPEFSFFPSSFEHMNLSPREELERQSWALTFMKY